MVWPNFQRNFPKKNQIIVLENQEVKDQTHFVLLLFLPHLVRKIIYGMVWRVYQKHVIALATFCLRKHFRRKRILVMYYSTDHHFPALDIARKTPIRAIIGNPMAINKKHWDCTAVHTWNESYLIVLDWISMLLIPYMWTLTVYACIQSHRVWDFYYYTLGAHFSILSNRLIELRY